MSQTFTHDPRTTFTMSDEDVEQMLRQPRRESRIENKDVQASRYVMTGTSSASRGRNRPRKFKR